MHISGACKDTWIDIRVSEYPRRPLIQISYMHILYKYNAFIWERVCILYTFGILLKVFWYYFGWVWSYFWYFSEIIRLSQFTVYLKTKWNDFVCIKHLLRTPYHSFLVYFVLHMRQLLLLCSLLFQILQLNLWYAAAPNWRLSEPIRTLSPSLNTWR